MAKIPEFATVDPFDGMTEADPGVEQNLVGGEWVDGDNYHFNVVDPMNGEKFLKIPDTSDHAEFIAGLKSCPKSGLHNPLKNPERYVALGEVFAKAATLLCQEEVRDYFAQLIMRVMPKPAPAPLRALDMVT